MKTIENDEISAENIEAIVTQFGEGFRGLAGNPRIAFEGDAVVIKLWKPIKVSGEEVGELRMEEPNMDQLRKLDGAGGPMMQAQRIIVSTCRITERESGALGMRDIVTISAVIAAFTAAAPATGSLF